MAGCAGSGRPAHKMNNKTSETEMKEASRGWKFETQELLVTERIQKELVVPGRIKSKNGKVKKTGGPPG